MTCLANIKIEKTAEYSNYGAHSGMSHEIIAFMENLGNDSQSAWCTSKLITEVVNKAIKASGKESAWVAIRAFTPTSAYDIPRWHTDGNFFLSDTAGLQYKIATALKGASTLFYPLPDSMRDDFNDVQQSAKFTLLPDGSLDKESFAKASLASRLQVNKMLNLTSSLSADVGQGVAFTVGSDFSAVHSEPPIKEPRLFLSIVPGSPAQINELYQRWHPKV